MLGSRTTLLTVVLALGTLAACGADDPDAAPATSTTAATTTSTSTTIERPSAAVDELIEVGDARMHLRCEGTGDTTVLLIPGFTDGGDQWGPVQTAVAERTRVCTFDRFGTGTSDPAPSVQTFASQTEDLRSLLDAAGEPGPYVLVGHSFGGAQAVTFADRYADDVTGLMLIDASPFGWYDTACTVADFAELCASLTDPAGNVERLDGAAAFAGLETVGSLADLPMVVVTAEARSYPGLAAPEVDRLTQIWDAGQADWAALSTSSRVVPVEDVGHYIHLDRPDLVTDQLEELLQETDG